MRRFILLAAIAIGAGCKVDKNDTPSLTFEEQILESWNAFGQSDYEEAYDLFQEAIEEFPDSAVVYSGFGWTLMKLDSLDRALAIFDAGSSRNDPPADLFAGWAFALNADKQYTLSNEKISTTLTTAPSWQFAYLPNINSNDLVAMAAENCFLTGQYAVSLQHVKVLSPTFSADVTTPEGRAALAAKIEELKVSF